MARICTRCQRANPTEAAYCYHDGTFLDDHPGTDHPDSGALDIGARPFATPFFLPSGRACNNFNQLATACFQDPEGAVSLLQKGYLEAFLGALGRADLAIAAHAAAASTDRDRALDEFLATLPGTALNPPCLRVDREMIDLGILRPGERRRCELILRNEGMRLLSGSATCSDTPWLVLGERPGMKRKLFQFTDQAELLVRIRGRHVRAYPKPQQGEIVLESNGGSLAVTVRFEVPVEPFPEGVLAGAKTPREMAEKAVVAGREAARLVESGAIARWYQANGWIYPVSGPAATGPAAVQQLFEALGLSRAPHVELSEDAIELSSAPGAMIEYVLAVLTKENRPAVAHGTSDQPWLHVGKTIFRNRTAMLPLTVPAVPSRPGETLLARVTVIANGKQRFVVPVVLEVRGAPLPVTRVSVVSEPTALWVPAASMVQTMPAAGLPPLPPAPASAAGLPPLPVRPGTRTVEPDLPTVRRLPPMPVEPVPADEPPGKRSIWPFLLGVGLLIAALLVAVGIKEALERNLFQTLIQKFRHH